MSETWKDIFERELRFYSNEWADNEALIEAVSTIAEEA